MGCKHWDPELSFCHCKEITLDPEEQSLCSQECQHYVPCTKSQMVLCRNCGKEFEFHENRSIDVRSKEYGICPNCGYVNLKTDDDVLSKGIE